MPRLKPQSEATERYRDSKGIALDQVALWLPPRVSDWPAVKRVKDVVICAKMHEWFKECWWCGYRSGWNTRIEAHHLAAGYSNGRSDEYCNIAMLCSECHAKVKTPQLSQSRLLRLKWEYDRQHTDWVRLCLLARKFLYIDE